MPPGLLLTMQRSAGLQAAYDHNRFYDAVGPMLGLLMALCLVYPLSMLIRCGLHAPAMS